MCYFVFVSVPSSKAASVENFNPVRLSVRSSSSSTVTAFFPKEHVVFEVTDGACSCSLYPSRQADLAEARKRAKYEQKGWSTNKIERALNSWRQHDAKKQNVGRIFNNWLEELVKTVGEVGIFAHWFTGSIGDELLASRYQLERRMEDGWNYPPDTLVIFRADVGQHT